MTLVKFVPLHLLFLMAGLFSPLSVYATAALEVEVWILDYDDLERMTPDNRAKYLLGLRDVIVEFEKSSEDGLVAATHEGFWHQVFSEFGLPAAFAVTAADCKSNEEFIPPRSCQVRGVSRSRLPDYDCNLIPVDPGSTLRNQAYTCRRTISRIPHSPIPGREMLHQTPIDRSVVHAPVLPPELRPRVPDKGPEAEAGRAASAANCRVKKPSCDNREKYRAEFYSQDRRSCVYGGNISQQREGTSRSRGRCKPVRKFTVTAGDTPKECPEGQTICNPLVFGYGEEPTPAGAPRAPAAERRFTVPLCVPAGREATEKCNRKAPKDNANHLFENSSNGFKDTWNEWKSNLRKMCNEQGEDPAAARFHCKECGIMLERLFALKAEFRGNLCKDLPGYVENAPAAER